MLISVCLPEFRVCHAINKLQKNKLETTQWKKPRKRNVIKDLYINNCLIYKQLSTIVQVSGLYGLQFLSYLPKRFTRLCRALYGDAMYICVQFWYRNMATRNQQNHLEFTFSIRAISFHSRASISAHKHIFYYEKRLNC